MNLPKLITDCEIICLIPSEISKREIEEIFIESNLKTLIGHIGSSIFNAKLKKTHHYRFKIQVHAQEIEKD